MGDRPLQHGQAGTVARDVRLQGEQEYPALLPRRVELGGEDDHLGRPLRAVISPEIGGNDRSLASALLGPPGGNIDGAYLAGAAGADRSLWSKHRQKAV